jgi:hypothetical protein
MTRPRKRTVDWFPHSCIHGPTMFILEEKYGIAGYYFWFRLLEMMGSTEDHTLDLKKPAVFRYLQAYTKSESDEKVIEILDVLSDLDAIDRELWKKKQIVWSDNFVRGILPLYRNRELKIPLKPDIQRQKPLSSEEDASFDPQGQGRTEKDKEGKDKKPSPPPDGVAPTPVPKPNYVFRCKHFSVTEDYFNELLQDFPAVTGKDLMIHFKNMRDWLDKNPHKHKRDTKGELKGPGSFIRNWLRREDASPGRKPNEPKGFAALRRFAEKEGLEDAD